MLFDLLIAGVAKNLKKLEFVENHGNIKNFENFQNFQNFQQTLFFFEFSATSAIMFKKHLLDQGNKLAYITWVRSLWAPVKINGTCNLCSLYIIANGGDAVSVCATARS